MQRIRPKLKGEELFFGEIQLTNNRSFEGGSSIERSSSPSLADDDESLDS